MVTIKRPGRVLCVIFALIAISGLFYPLQAKEPESGMASADLVIIHTNDIHGHLKPHIYKKISKTDAVGGLANAATIIRQIRSRYKGKTLYLDAGDIAQGTPVSNIFRGKPVVEILNLLKADAVVLGNHEFDWGRENLDRMIGWAQYPVLGANIYTDYKNGKLIKGVKPYIIKKVNGRRIGILGLLTDKTPSITSVANTKGLYFEPVEKAAEKYVREIRAKGAEYIIVLSHQGYEEDVQLAEKVRGISVIVGGHGHSVIRTPGIVGDTVIIQAGSYGRYVGMLPLKFGKNGLLIPLIKDSELIDVFDKRQAPDPEIKTVIDKYEKQIKEQMSEVVGHAPIDLTRSSNGDHADSVLGNAICDSFIKATGCAIAMYNPGGIRSDIYRGPITLEQIYTALPFDDQLISCMVTGRKVRELMEHGASGSGSAQVGGIAFHVDYSKPPGSRVSEIMVRGEPLEEDRMYPLATVDFLFNGGDRYDFSGASGIRRGSFSRDVFVQYIRELKDYNTLLPGRIKK